METKKYMSIIEATLNWRKNWVDMKDEIEADKGCDCEVCKLIRAIDEYLKTDKE